MDCALMYYRKKARMRQFDLARRLGVSEQLVSKWETGRAIPTIETMVDVSRIVGVDPALVWPGAFATAK